MKLVSMKREGGPSFITLRFTDPEDLDWNFVEGSETKLKVYLIDVDGVIKLIEDALALLNPVDQRGM
jgi:hypothetical protein